MNTAFRRAALVATAASAMLSLNGRCLAADTYNDDEVAKAASAFFSSGARELSDVMAKVLKDKVELGAGARVSGNVSYGVIEMAAGAVIQGRLVAPAAPADTGKA